MSYDPLVVTLLIEPEAQQYFDRLRTRHFPAARLQVGAHVTLFHALPGDALVAVTNALAMATCGEPTFVLTVAGVRSLGRGVAYDLHSPDLLRLREELRTQFTTRLTTQDSQRWKPHVTIQNKVDVATARALLTRLQRDFAPFAIRAEGLALWHYRGGPWEQAGQFRFAT